MKSIFYVKAPRGESPRPLSQKNNARTNPVPNHTPVVLQTNTITAAPAKPQSLKKPAQGKPASASKTLSGPLYKLDSITQARDIHGNEIKTADMLVSGGAKPPTNEKPSAPSKPVYRPPIRPGVFKPGFGISSLGNLKPGFEWGPNGMPRPIDYSMVPYRDRPLHAIPQHLQVFYQNSPTSPHYRPPLKESISIGRPQSAPAPVPKNPSPLDPRNMVYSPGANYKDDPMYSTREIERRQNFESMRMDAAEQQGKKYEFQNQEQKAQFIAEGGSWDSKSKASGKHPFERLTSQEYGALNLAAQAGDKDAKRELDERFQRGQRYIMDSASAQELLKRGNQKREQEMVEPKKRPQTRWEVEQEFLKKNEAQNALPAAGSAIPGKPGAIADGKGGFSYPGGSSPLNKLDSITQARDIHGNEIETADMLVSGGVKLQQNQRAEKKPESKFQFRNIGGQVRIVGKSGPETASEAELPNSMGQTQPKRVSPAKSPGGMR